MTDRTRYVLVCTITGLLLAPLPRLVHGPIPAKFDLFYIDGSTAVWAWYVARMMIGLVFAVTVLPERWWQRGPLAGALTMFPVTIMSLAVPTCGAPCMGWNLLTGSIIGLIVSAVSYLILDREHL
ncbi:MAG: hypothetical protein ACI8TX_002545 [Hyphomicrobiaceae bacterium]|jgi:hypothetical protein